MTATYRNLNMAIPAKDWDIYKSFFESQGGFTKFVKTNMQKAGFKDRESLREVARRCKEADLKDYMEFDHLSGEGIE